MNYRNKPIKKFLLFFLAFIGMQTYYSCSNQSSGEKVGLVSNAEMNLTIEGMTCPKGCAKTIEETVAALPGVTYSKVNFEEKSAIFKYDDTKTTEKEILDAITELKEGQYKLSKVEVKIEKKINEDGNTNEIEAVEEKLIKDTAI